MILEDCTTYWEQVATNNIAIGHTGTKKHFTKFTVEEALSGFKGSVESPLLAMQLPEMRLIDALSDNPRYNTSGAVLIIKKVSVKDGFSAVQDAYVEMEVIARQIITKLKNDAKRALQGSASTPSSLIKYLDLNSISIIEVGPIFEAHYGWRIEYQLNGPINLDLNESEWTGETKYTF